MGSNCPTRPVKVLELHEVVCVIFVIGSTSVESAMVITIGADTTDCHIAVSTVVPALPVVGSTRQCRLRHPLHYRPPSHDAGYVILCIIDPRLMFTLHRMTR